MATTSPLHLPTAGTTSGHPVGARGHGCKSHRLAANEGAAPPPHPIPHRFHTLEQLP